MVRFILATITQSSKLKGYSENNAVCTACTSLPIERTFGEMWKDHLCDIICDVINTRPSLLFAWTYLFKISIQRYLNHDISR